ncbi:hypothetical protein [Ralstonia mojiangensis]|nr:hypothetical protein [Ralstonia mojiangensis]MCT7325030.1 hypothetical protein [Ralstonia mojiangensis]
MPQPMPGLVRSLTESAIDGEAVMNGRILHHHTDSDATHGILRAVPI